MAPSARASDAAPGQSTTAMMTARSMMKPSFTSACSKPIATRIDRANRAASGRPAGNPATRTAGRCRDPVNPGGWNDRAGVEPKAKAGTDGMAFARRLDDRRKREAGALRTAGEPAGRLLLLQRREIRDERVDV